MRLLKVLSLVLALSVIKTSVTLAWSPSSGEESQLFNQYVTEQLNFIPQKRVYKNGKFSHLEGPTYEQQWDWEHKKRMDEGKDAANKRNNTISNSTKEIKKLQGDLQKDQRVTDLKQKRANAQARVTKAGSLKPDGPTQTQMNKRLNNTLNAGGRLDANKDGVIDENERKAALSSRVSMQKKQYLNEKKLDIDGDNELTTQEAQGGLVEVAGKNKLDHNNLLSEYSDKKIGYEDRDSAQIGSGAYVDADGVTRDRKSLNNSQNLASELRTQSQNRDRANVARGNSPMTAQKLRSLTNVNGKLTSNSQAMPTTTHRHASITTSGSKGITRSWNGSWNASAGVTGGTAQINQQMQNPQASQNKFLGQLRTSTTGFQRSEAQARANLEKAKNLRN